MEDETDDYLNPPVPEPIFSWRDLDEETIEILVDDKIATGG